jgi:amino acid adenylation domain-containing protein
VAELRPQDLRTGYHRDWPPVLLGRFLLQHAAADPGRIAVVAPGGTYTYGELAAAADSYRQVLRAAGLRHGDVVAVRMEPGFEALAVLLACSEAGFVYVPFNADAAAARVAEACRHTDARVLVTAPGRTAALPAADGRAPLNAVAEGPRLVVEGGPAAGPGPDRAVLESDVAYVIFTSGSTGAPKGVAMSHRAALVAFRAIADACDAPERVASVAPLGFDFNLFDAAAALGRGRTLVYLPRSLYVHPRSLVEQLAAHRVQQLHCVPSLWALLLRHCADRLGTLTELRRTVTGGEELPVGVVARIRAALPHLEVLNAYGPTESVCCAFYKVPDPLPQDWQAVPIGRAHPGGELLLIGEDGAEIDRPGVTGEVYLRTAALFEGYWRADDLTARVVVPDPLGRSRERMFRTGDLAVAGPEGLTFVGRRDHQVQIYGNRVELEEIERRLAEVPGVTAAGVADIRRDSEHLLVAGIVADGGPDSAALRAHCREHLPKYMVPARFLPLEALPLGGAGKLDRNSLRALLVRALEAPKPTATVEAAR